jgi:phage terminase large subunit
MDDVPTIKLPANDWVPRHYQRSFWKYMQDTPWGARAILCHHRRAGKDHTALNWTACASQMRIGLYAYIFPYANQARRVIWNGIDRNGHRFMSAFPDELIDSKSDLEMRLKLTNGSVFQLLGADDPDKLVGINCVGAVFSEFAIMNPVALDLVMPILNENGGWALFPSTPRGENHFYSLTEQAKTNPKWFVSIETVDTTGAIDPAMIEEERKRGVEEALIQQEYYCSFSAPLQGAYYEKQMSRLLEDKRITEVPHEQALPVHTAWDLGVNDSTCIWCFQLPRDGQPRIIDYIEATGEGLPYYATELDRRAHRHSWVFGTHYAPHDIAVRDLGTGKTRIETARELGIRFRIVPKALVEDGIEAVRQLLLKCWFDKKHASRGIECLRSYRKEWDERLKVYRNKPRHDEFSHGADAFRTLAMGIRATPPNRNDENRPRSAQSDYDPFA